MKKILFIIFKSLKKVDMVIFSLLSSWKTNYNSWKVQKKIPIKFIKYEDLIDQTYMLFF